MNRLFSNVIRGRGPEKPNFRRFSKQGVKENKTP